MVLCGWEKANVKQLRWLVFGVASLFAFAKNSKHGLSENCFTVHFLQSGLMLALSP
jgi:hypothetical protein